MDEGHRTNVLGSRVRIGRTGTGSLQALQNEPRENLQNHIQHRPVALHEVAQPFGNRQHPLAHRQTGESMVRQVRRRLHHTPGVARGTHAPALVGEGDEVVMPAVTTAGTGKAMRKDAAFQIFAKRLADTGLWRTLVTLPVELARPSQVSKCWAIVW